MATGSQFFVVGKGEGGIFFVSEKPPYVPPGPESMDFDFEAYTPPADDEVDLNFE